MNYPNNRNKSRFEKHIGIFHCHYCGEETEFKDRKCEKCRDTVKCKRCKKRLKQDKFEKGKLVCSDCINKIKEEENIKIKEKHKVDVVCSKCNKKEEVERRYRNKPKIHICNECLNKKNNIEGNLIKCKFCKKEFLLISSSHLKKCKFNFDNIDYKKYIELFGRIRVYSEKYRNTLIQTNKERDQSFRIKISKKSKAYWENNYEDICGNLKIAQNTFKAKENHRNGYLNYFKNSTEEQKKQRSESAKKSWRNPETRKKRIEAINTPESIEARKKGGRKAAFITQRKIPKITSIQLKISNKLTELGIYNVLEYEFGFYHIDIGLPQYTIAIETDGDYWHGNPKFYKKLSKQQKDRQSRDKARNTYLFNRGWKVLRFWGSDIENDFDNCINKILQTIEERKCLTKIA